MRAPTEEYTDRGWSKIWLSSWQNILRQWITREIVFFFKFLFFQVQRLSVRKKKKNAVQPISAFVPRVALLTVNEISLRAQTRLTHRTLTKTELSRQKPIIILSLQFFSPIHQESANSRNPLPTPCSATGKSIRKPLVKCFSYTPRHVRSLYVERLRSARDKCFCKIYNNLRNRFIQFWDSEWGDVAVYFVRWRHLYVSYYPQHIFLYSGVSRRERQKNKKKIEVTSRDWSRFRVSHCTFGLWMV